MKTVFLLWIFWKILGDSQRSDDSALRTTSRLALYLLTTISSPSRRSRSRAGLLSALPKTTIWIFPFQSLPWMSGAQKGKILQNEKETMFTRRVLVVLDGGEDHQEVSGRWLVLCCQSLEPPRPWAARARCGIVAAQWLWVVPPPLCALRIGCLWMRLLTRRRFPEES